MELKIDSQLKQRFPDLAAKIMELSEVTVKESSVELEAFSEETARRVASKYTLEAVKDVPIFRAYRDFYWKVGIDPTKNRPSGEALTRRVLAGRRLPKINSLVDAYNAASLESGVAIAAFDKAKIDGDLLMRVSEVGEKFQGIAMPSPIELNGGEVVVSDSRQLVAMYPYRDSDHSKVTVQTREVVLMICGVPGVAPLILDRAGDMTVNYVLRFCGGRRSAE